MITCAYECIYEIIDRQGMHAVGCEGLELPRSPIERSQTELAAAMGITRSSVSQIERETAVTVPV